VVSRVNFDDFKSFAFQPEYAGSLMVCFRIGEVRTVNVSVTGDKLECDRLFTVFHGCIIPQSKGYVQN